MTQPEPKPGAAERRPLAVVEVTAADLTDLGAIYCPNPKMPLWSTHPRVFLDVGNTGEAKCAYCSTVYRLAPGVEVRGH